MPFAPATPTRRSPLAASLYFTSRSTTRLTASPARTSLTWWKVQCQRVRRVRLLPALRHTRPSSIYFPLGYPPLMRCTQQFSLESPTGRRRPPESRGVNSSRTKFLQRGPTTAPMLSSRPRAAAVPACGSRRRRRFFPICCRNGGSSCHLE